MAKCYVCNREMLKDDGCKRIPVIYKGKIYEPIKVGDDGDFFFEEANNPNYRCGDCGAKVGNYHHEGCDCERCPVCGMQALTCGCKDEDDLED